MDQKKKEECVKYEENIKKQMDRLLDKYEKPRKDAAVLEKMRKILLERGVGEDLLNTIEAMQAPAYTASVVFGGSVDKAAGMAERILGG